MTRCALFVVLMAGAGCDVILPLSDKPFGSADQKVSDLDGRSSFEGVSGGDSDGQPDVSRQLPTCIDKVNGTLVAAYLLDRGKQDPILPPQLGSASTAPAGHYWGAVSRDLTSPCGHGLSFAGKYGVPPEAGPHDMGLAKIPHAAIPQSPLWKLTSGSIDFQLLLRKGAGLEGILVRDAHNSDTPGHLAVLRYHDRVVVRIQGPRSEHGLACSSPLALDTWHHVQVLFGGTSGLQLILDGGKTPSFDGTLSGTGHGLGTLDCSSPGMPVGIDGNDNVWVLGAVSWSTPDGAPMDQVKLQWPLHGSIAALVIRSLP